MTERATIGKEKKMREKNIFSKQTYICIGMSSVVIHTFIFHHGLSRLQGHEIGGWLHHGQVTAQGHIDNPMRGFFFKKCVTTTVAAL